MPEGDTNEVSVKVAVRIRPLTNREKQHHHQPCVRILSETNQIVIGKDKVFTFDYVLPPKTNQSSLYDDCVDGLVTSLFEGYNATVFAYGQTGSGKTYTISGNTAREEEIGIIPRAVKRMFSIMTDQHNKQFSIKVSYLEIYKEELKDLLDPSPKELHIREDECGNITISGASEAYCSTLEEVMACFNTGTTYRHTGSTNMNEQSSRSHSIFSVCVEQRWASSTDFNSKINQQNQSMNEHYDTNLSEINDTFYLGAKFHFVDLAGSERVGRTGNVGDRFKESIHINSGLLALGNVISALSSTNDKKKSLHIPYRDSKITRILKDSLGGNAKTLMICCISPSSCNLDESINAVKYASRARYIKNKPIINMDPQTQRFVEMQSEIKALREELHRQRTQLLSAENNLNQHNADEGERKQLENRLMSVQNECDQYKKLVKDACSRFKEISKFDMLDDSIRSLISNWFETVETSKNRLDFDSEDYAKQRIMQLEMKLRQAQNDLKSDEEIFSDKEKEISDLKEKIKDLEANLSTANRYLEASYAKEKEQQELMVQLQIQLDRLMQGKQSETMSRLSSIHESELANDDTQKSNLQSKSVSTPALNNPVKQRAKTAPNSQANQLKVEARRNRNVFSSPALFSLEKVMQGFRARSQLLAETLEENDNVLQKQFLSSDNDDDRDETKNHFVRRGTYSKKKTLKKAQQNDEDDDGDLNGDELNTLTKSTEFRQKVLKESELKLREAQKKMRDLSINIKMKEELIKELVASSKSAHRVNVQYQHRIDNLQKEANLAKSELAEMQRALQQFSSKDVTEKSKLEIEYKRKLEQAQHKITELEARQKDTIKIMNAPNTDSKRINELELALNKMKQQQEILQRKIKEESEKKIKLEKDLEKEQQRIKELQTRNDQQQKILKKKTEDLAVAQRKLRSASSAGDASSTSNKHWVEQEMEKILQEKKQLEIIREELIKREELCRKKEALLQEKNELQIKKLRSSQVVRESLNLVNQKIDSLDKQIKDSGAFKENLHETHNTLIQQRKQLDERLSAGCVLSTAEERRLIEIEEAIEALEVAIQFETESINDQEAKLKKSHVSMHIDENELSDNVLNKLGELPYEEAKYLVRKFFTKIIDLKELERKKQLINDELQVQLDEKQRLCDELKKSINLTSSDLDRRLVIQQQQYERQINGLLEKLSDCSNKISNYEKEINQLRDKLRKTTATKRINNNDDENHELTGESLFMGQYGTSTNSTNNIDSNRKISFQNLQTNGFHLNDNQITAVTSQQYTARTISSSAALSTNRQVSAAQDLGNSLSNSTKPLDRTYVNGIASINAATSLGLSMGVGGNSVGAGASALNMLNSKNYVKDSLADSMNNNDQSSKQVIKISKKDLRPLSEDEVVKRSKKATS